MTMNDLYKTARQMGKSQLAYSLLHPNGKTISLFPTSNTRGSLRSDEGSEFAIPSHLYSGSGYHLMVHDGILPPAPTTTIADREYLGLTVGEYRNFAENVHHAYINREGDVCLLKNAKTKKLKNIRYKIIKSEFLLQSMIWRAQLQSIEQEIRRRRAQS
jgi:hypothetical protein